MKAVQLLLNSYLPEEFRNYEREYTKKEIMGILAGIAEKYPDKYADTIAKIAKAGRENSYLQGETLGLEDMKPTFDKQPILDEMHKKVKATKLIRDPEKQKTARMAIYMDTLDKLHKETMSSSMQKKTTLANSVLSGARGNPTQLRSMITTPGLYADYKDNPIDLFVENSYGEGLRPADYLASTFGARKSVIATKACYHIDTQVLKIVDGILYEVAIKDIKVGDTIMGADREGNSFPTKVKAVYDQGLQDVYEWKFGYSSETLPTISVKCTEDHKFLMRNPKAYRKAYSRLYRSNNKSFSVKDLYHSLSILPIKETEKRYYSLVPVNQVTYDNTHLRSEPYAYLLGLLVGDGSVVTYPYRGRLHQRCEMSMADPKLISFCEDLCNSLGLKLSKASSDYGYKITRQDIKSPKTHLNILRDEGLAGKYSFEKLLPKNIHSWDNESIAKFIAAYFACDGSNVKTKTAIIVTFSSTSKELLKGVAKILRQRFSIYTNRVKSTVKGGFASSTTERKHVLHTIAISGHQNICKFYDLIGKFIPGYKKEKLEEQINSYVVKQSNPRPLYNLREKTYLGQLPCVDIEVDSPDHLFVLANGLIGSNSTADAGFLGKQMGFSSADLVVTEEDSGSSHGIKLSTNHLGDLKGRVLARPVGPFNAGTVIDKQVMAEINKKKVPFVLVKSPLTSYTSQGIDAQSIGMMPDKRFARIGDAVGLTASSASSEPVIQGSLGTKHLSGAVKGQKMQFSGFNVINQMMQAPKTFPNKAVLAELDGFVEKVEEAPQGGYYIYIGGEKHYTGPGVEPLVKAGQEVEAGEQLADGLIDPKDVLRLRGIGEARKYYVDRLRQIYDDSGIPVERINLELLARNAINHITLEDNTDYPDIVPDTVISYNEFASRYKPAEDSKELRPTKAVGTYLQSPALHYTIGTRVTPKIAKELEETGYDSVYASPKEPPFKPLFSRLMTANENQEDWFGRLHGSHLTKNLQTAAEQGQDTNILSNTHFAPRFAYGKDFGKTLTTTGKY